MDRDLEKKIYELLGVNVFRKYVLFTWEKIAGFFHLPIGYRLDDMSIDGIKAYKNRTKSFALAHVFCFFICLPFLYGPLSWIYNIFLNLYCIIVQRYNYIRIEEIEEKYVKYQNLKEKREKRQREKELAKEYGELLQYIKVFSERVNTEVFPKSQESTKIVSIRKFNIPDIPKKTIENSQVLMRKAS